MLGRRLAGCVFIAVGLLGAACSSDYRASAEEPLGRTQQALWYDGNFRKLTQVKDDLVSWIVSNTSHSSTTYGMTSTSRETAFRNLLDKIYSAYTTTDDWCDVKDYGVSDAFYDVRRFYDTVLNRYLVLLTERTSNGQATIVINLVPRRNIIIEAPHAAPGTNDEYRTKKEAAYLFQKLGARALIINGSWRCADTDYGGCVGPASAMEA